MTIDHTKIQRLATQCGVTSHHRADKMLMESIRQVALAAQIEVLNEAADACTSDDEYILRSMVEKLMDNA